MHVRSDASATFLAPISYRFEHFWSSSLVMHHHIGGSIRTYMGVWEGYAIT